MVEHKNFRHEFKYICSDIQLEILKSRLKNILPLDINADSGVYNIRSVYFDDYENKCFFENESGTDPREKFRIRIYNKSDKRIALECKRKERDKTHKDICILSKFDYECIMKSDELDKILYKSNLLNRFILLLKNELYTPKIIVEYERTPYVYKLGNVRITFDKNIRSSKDFNRFFSKDIHSRPILPSRQHILEVKYDEYLPDFIKDILQIDNLHRNTFSKYYLCRKYSPGGII